MFFFKKIPVFGDALNQQNKKAYNNKSPSFKTFDLQFKKANYS